MKEDSMLTIASLLNFLLLTFHLAGDIVYDGSRASSRT